MTTNAHILSKKRPFSRKYCALMSFFQKVFMINMPLSYPCLVENVNSVKITLYYGPQESIGCHFPIFLEKISAHMPIFRQKNVHSLKITVPSCPNLVRKRPFSQKNCVIMSFFSNFSQKIPCSHARI